jgi:hypothetical protein
MPIKYLFDDLLWNLNAYTNYAIPDAAGILAPKRQ